MGGLGSYAEGDSVELYGTWVSHPQYGDQLKVTRSVSYTPTSADSLEAYLSSGSFPRIGPAIARRIVQRFEPDAIVGMLREGRLEPLLEVKGVSQRVLDGVTKAWDANKGQKDLVMFLQAHGVGLSLVPRLRARYGESALSMLQTNPYRLVTDIRGVGFATADAIARKLGMDDESDHRMQAGLLHALHAAGSEGHCCLPHDELLERAVRVLSGQATYGVSYGRGGRGGGGGGAKGKAAGGAKRGRRPAGRTAYDRQAAAALAAAVEEEEGAADAGDAGEDPDGDAEPSEAVLLRNLRLQLEDLVRRRAVVAEPADDEDISSEAASVDQGPRGEDRTTAAHADGASTAASDDVDTIDLASCVFFGPPAHRAEESLARRVAALINSPPASALVAPAAASGAGGGVDAPPALSPWRTHLADVLREHAEARIAAGDDDDDVTELTKEQIRAVEVAMEQPLSIITGGPGTGKTFATRTIVEVWRRMGLKVALACPTARSAHRLNDMMGSGGGAMTLHRLLEFGPSARREASRRAAAAGAGAGAGAGAVGPGGAFEVDDAFASTPGQSFRRNARLPLDADVVLVDEASMLDLYVANALFSALPVDASAFDHHASRNHSHARGHHGGDNTIVSSEAGGAMDRAAGIIDASGEGALSEDAPVPRARPVTIVLVGDVDQLPSVGAGRVLADLLNSGVVPATRLTQVFRQAAASNIVQNAHDVNRGRMPSHLRHLPVRSEAGAATPGGDDPHGVDGDLFAEVAPTLTTPTATAASTRSAASAAAAAPVDAGDTAASGPDVAADMALGPAMGAVGIAATMAPTDLASVAPQHSTRTGAPAATAATPDSLLAGASSAREAEAELVASAFNAAEAELVASGSDCLFADTPLARDGVEAVATHVLDYVRQCGFHAARDLQVLAPMRRGPLGTDTLNKALRRVLNPQPPGAVGLHDFYVGDRVMQHTNAYDRGVINGDIGHVERVEGDSLWVAFDEQDLELPSPADGGGVGETSGGNGFAAATSGRGSTRGGVAKTAGAKGPVVVSRGNYRLVSYSSAEVTKQLTHAYAVTVHKAQGSEWPVVVLAVHQSAYVMLSRGLLYTALARAQRLAVIVGTKKAMAIAVRETRDAMRHSRLGRRLLAACTELRELTDAEGGSALARLGVGGVGYGTGSSWVVEPVPRHGPGVDGDGRIDNNADRSIDASVVAQYPPLSYEADKRERLHDAWEDLGVGSVIDLDDGLEVGDDGSLDVPSLSRVNATVAAAAAMAVGDQGGAGAATNSLWEEYGLEDALMSVLRPTPRNTQWRRAAKQ